MKTLTESEARALGKQIAKDSSNVRVKFGTTNGSPVLHVFVPGDNENGRTIRSAAEWEDHPANEKARRNNRFAAEQETEKLMETNRPEADRA